VEEEEEEDGLESRECGGAGLPQPSHIVGDLLDLILPPSISKEAFFAEFWEQKALFVCNEDAGPQTRFSARVLSEYLLGLDVEALVEASPSEEVHVWVASRMGGPSASFKTSDLNVAMGCYKTGAASLYFRAPQPLIDTLISGMGFSLGAQFGCWGADNSLRGEIETFVSRPGNVTDWHLDFQENFTFQLQGSKKWLLRRSHLRAPVRGFTPHFEISADVKDQQWCSARMDSSTKDWSFDKCLEEDEVVEVVLRPGDVLYHPSGLLHRVETVSEEDSISINLSMDLLRFSDYLGDSVRALLMKETETRQHIAGNYDLQAKLETLKKSGKWPDSRHALSQRLVEGPPQCGAQCCRRSRF